MFQPALRHQRHSLLPELTILPPLVSAVTREILQAVAIGAANFVFTLLAMTVIDKLGRKKLLLFGSVGTAICLAGVAAVFFTNSHHEPCSSGCWSPTSPSSQSSQGAVIWVYISEVFPTKVRSKGQSLGSSSHWIMNAAIAFTFPLLAKTSGAYPVLCLLRRHDGGAVLCRTLLLPRRPKASPWSSCSGSLGDRVGRSEYPSAI